MSDFILSQSEADKLFGMDKYTDSSDKISVPGLGGKLKLNFNSADGLEVFVIDFARGRVNLVKRSHHLREKNNIGLARLCLHGESHTNPDGKKIGPCHLHLYKEGYELGYAYNIPSGDFRDLSDIKLTLQDFMKFCNVVKAPKLVKESCHVNQ